MKIGVLPLDDILALLNTSIGFGSSNTRVCFIGITRPDAWYKVETEKIKSRIQEVIKFDAYTLEEAAQILKWRRNLAFRDGVLEDSDNRSHGGDGCRIEKYARGDRINAGVRVAL